MAELSSLRIAEPQTPASAAGRIAARGVVVHGGDIDASLLSELTQAFSAQGRAAPLVVEGSAGEGVVLPYRAIAQAVLALGRHDLGSSVERQAQALLSSLSTRSTSADPLESVRVRDARSNQHEAFRRVFVAAASVRPLVVVLRDLHLADADTLGLLEYLSAEAAATSTVVSLRGRVTPAPRWLITADDEHAVGALVVDRLARAGFETVAAGRLDAAAVGRIAAEPDVASKLIRLSSGRTRRLRALFELLPSSLEVLAQLKLEGLDARLRHTLAVAHAAQVPLDASALASLADVSRFEVERLVNLGLLVSFVDGGARRLRPSEAMLAAAVVPFDSDASACRFHERFAERLLADDPTDAEVLARAARHLGLAGRGERAGAVALMAARQLAAIGAFARARDAVEIAEATTGPHATEAGLLRIELDVATGNLAEAVVGCERLLASRSTSDLALRYARLVGLSGDLARAEVVLTGLLARNDLSPRLRLAAARELGEVLLRRGHFDPCERLTSELLATCATPTEGRPFRHLRAKVALFRGDWVSAEAAFEGLLTEAWDDDRERGALLHNHGLVALRRGRHVEACRRIGEALLVLESAGAHAEAAVCRHNLAIAEEWLQRYDAALTAFESSVDAFDHLGKHANLAGALNSLGDLFRTLGDAWRARRVLEQSLAVCRSHGLDLLAAVNGLRLAQVALLEGATDAASAGLDRTIVDLETIGAQEYLGEALAVRASLRLELGDRAAALTDATAATHATDGEPLARAQLVLARLLPLPTQRAAAAAEVAIAFDALGQRDGAAQALTLAAHAALAARELASASHHLAEARARRDEWLRRVPTDLQEGASALPWVRAVDALESQCQATATPPMRLLERASDAIGEALSGGSSKIVGRSPAIRRVLDMISRLGDCSAPILIVGESGTGKELVAEALHAASDRSARPLVRVNTAAFAESLLESELFGHEKGAFTGAVQRKVGAFEQGPARLAPGQGAGHGLVGAAGLGSHRRR